MRKELFWDFAYSSEKRSKALDMLDGEIPKVSIQFSYSLLGDVQNKKLLEIGCGSGYQTILFASKGAQVTAIDISKESVNATRALCKKNNIQNAEIKQMAAELLQFKDNTFDRIYINKVLLHTDKDRVISECFRVLKKGGIIVFTEMLKNWIFSFPYRVLSPYRKANPHYLTLKEVQMMTKVHKEFYLFSTFFLFLFYLPFPGSVKIGSFLFNTFARVDSLVWEILPFLKKYAWITVAALQK